MTTMAGDLAARIDERWDDDVILPTLTEYIRIPDVSKAFDAGMGGERPHGAGRGDDPGLGAWRVPSPASPWTSTDFPASRR